MLDHANLSDVTRYIDPNDPRVTAHRLPMAKACDTLDAIVTTAAHLMDAVIADAPQETQENIRNVARAQFEAYLDLMAEAATHSRKLKP